MTNTREPKRVGLLAPPESTSTPIHGMYETLVLVDAVAGPDGGVTRLFDVEIVGPQCGILPSACGLPLEVHHSIEEVENTHIVIAASMLFDNQEWVTGRLSAVFKRITTLSPGEYRRKFQLSTRPFSRAK